MEEEKERTLEERRTENGIQLAGWNAIGKDRTEDGQPVAKLSVEGAARRDERARGGT